ncbi:MAG: hypothetical protein IT389_05060 [Nitrospira sp.]|nr:hypothetical protein [Nitrospira sp.]
MASKSVAKIELENKARRDAQLIAAFGGAINTLIKYGAFVLIAYAVENAAAALAGKETLAAFSFQGIASYVGKETSVAEWAQYAIIAALLIWGSVERKLRKDVIQRLHGRIHHLEKQIDPKRTSSQLTPRGDTREVDKP